jgi:hypothetical protein
MNPHFGVWVDCESGLTQLGRTRRCCGNRRTFRPVNGRRLLATCWCEAAYVRVDANDIARGITYACGDTCSRLAIGRGYTMTPIIAPDIIRMREVLSVGRERRDAERQVIAARDRPLPTPRVETPVMPPRPIFTVTRLEFDAATPQGRLARRILKFCPVNVSLAETIDVYAESAVIHTRGAGGSTLPARIHGDFLGEPDEATTKYRGKWAAYMESQP